MMYNNHAYLGQVLPEHDSLSPLRIRVLRLLIEGQTTTTRIPQPVIYRTSDRLMVLDEEQVTRVMMNKISHAAS